MSIILCAENLKKMQRMLFIAYAAFICIFKSGVKFIAYAAFICIFRSGMKFIAYAAFIFIFSAMYAIYCICSIYLHISVHPTEIEL